MNNLEKLSDANNLFDAFLKAKKGSDWKYSVQRCEANLLSTIYNLQKSLRDGTYKQQPFYEFIMRERGKIRPIRSQPIEDRIVQRSLCDNILLPAIRPCLIHDNGASLKGKGVSFTRKRLKAHLEKYLRRYDDGYVLLVDFSKFFDNIPHKELLSMIQARLGKDTSLYSLIESVLLYFRPDVSYMSDNEYVEAANVPFNTLTHRERVQAYSGQEGLRFLDKSMAIGSQISQIAGVFYPSRIDNFFKTRCGYWFYGRYMDDVYVIHHDKKRLQRILDEFIEQAEQLKIFVNKKKTQIEKLSRGFTYLQTRYRVVDGRVVSRLSNKTFVRERRRLKKFKHLLDAGRITLKQIVTAYTSWRGTVKRHANRALNIKYTDSVFMRLFTTRS